MGQCLAAPAEINKDAKRILSLVRHGGSSLGNARMVSHIDLWEEFTLGGSEKIVLGEGLNGPVLKIFSKKDPNLCFALKEIRTVNAQNTGGPSNSVLVGLVLNELEVVLQLDHFHIARVYEVYESSASVFLITELCRGGELYTKLEQVKRFNEIETTFIVSQILKAVNYMHNLDIIHGDLKLENFLFSNKLEPGSSIFKSPLKLIDFGFSHLGSSARRANLLCGSPQYMAPEKGEGETTKSDMWSVGVITFMLLTGKAPFKAAKSIEEMQRIFSANSSKISMGFRAGLEKFSISLDAIDFVARLVEFDPEKRMSARDALSHRWLAGMELRRTHSRLSVVSDLKQCIELLVEFSELGPLRRASIGLISMYGPPLMTLRSAPAVFDAIDTNNDGFIQFDELESVLAKSTAETVFNAVDLVGDGRINFSEFIAATDVYLTIKITTEKLPASYEAIIESVFRKLDVDNSGFISESNLLALFGRKGYKGTRTRDLIKEGDFVGDGVISLNEFFSLIHNG